MSVSGKSNVLSGNQQLHVFLPKRLLEGLTGEKCVGDTCGRESDALSWVHEYSPT